MPSGKTAGWCARLAAFGRLLFALAVIGIGLETLICVSGHKIVPVIPWLPAIAILAYSAGIIFVVCGAGLLFKPRLPAPAIALGVVMFLSALLFDVPRHPDLMSAPWRTNVLEPIAIAGLAWLAPGMDKVPGWLSRASRYLLAFTLIVFGIAHFQIVSAIGSMVPAWIPWHEFWTVFFGAAFIAAGLSFATGFLQRPAALALGLMFAVWILTIHLPALLRAIQNPDAWSDVLIVLALWGGFWAVMAESRDARNPC